ncbi:MAG: hypothetical protein JWR61_2278 [Ferruginibacter sp.]|nr:hypothetical protein [Ferruginibacter sp.]
MAADEGAKTLAAAATYFLRGPLPATLGCTKLKADAHFCTPLHTLPYL